MIEAQNIDQVDNEDSCGYGLESQLFDWEGWDQQDTMCFGFHDVTLRVQVGDYPPGTKFEYADMNYGSSIMSFHQLDGPRDENGNGMLKEVFRAKIIMKLVPVPVPPQKNYSSKS